MTTLEKSKRIRYFLIALIILGALVRFFICFQHNPLDYLFSDPKRHWLNGQRLFSPDLMGAGDPLLYQIYVFILRAFAGDNRYVIALACGLLSMLMPWTFYRASREFGFSRNEGLGAWCGIVWLPSLATIYHYFMMETLLLLLIGLALWMTGRCLRVASILSWLVAVVCWILAVMTKPTIFPLALCCLAYIWFRRSCNWRWAVIGAVVALVMMIPNTLRTQHYLGFIAPLGNPWITEIQHRSGAREIKIHFNGGTWGFASPSVAIQPLEPLSPWMMRRALEKTTVTVYADSTHGMQDWRNAYDQLQCGWKEWFLQLKENIVLFLFSPSWPDSNQNEWDGWLNYQLRWIWAPVMFFVLDCNVREFIRREFHLLPLSVTILMLFLMFQNVATTEGRYRKPLEPLLVLNLIWALRSQPPVRKEI